MLSRFGIKSDCTDFCGGVLRQRKDLDGPQADGRQSCQRGADDAVRRVAAAPAPLERCPRPRLRQTGHRESDHRTVYVMYVMHTTQRCAPAARPQPHSGWWWWWSDQGFWVSPNADGADWVGWDVEAEHSKRLPSDPWDAAHGTGTTSYTGIAEVEPGVVLLVPPLPPSLNRAGTRPVNAVVRERIVEGTIHFQPSD